MRNPARRRIDYVMGLPACSAMDRAAELLPHLSRQALLDHLVIWGLWAIETDRGRPPPLPGSNRAYWRPKSEGGESR